MKDYIAHNVWSCLYAVIIYKFLLMLGLQLDSEDLKNICEFVRWEDFPVQLWLCRETHIKK